MKRLLRILRRVQRTRVTDFLAFVHFLITFSTVKAIKMHVSYRCYQGYLNKVTRQKNLVCPKCCFYFAGLPPSGAACCPEMELQLTGVSGSCGRTLHQRTRTFLVRAVHRLGRTWMAAGLWRLQEPPGTSRRSQTELTPQQERGTLTFLAPVCKKHHVLVQTCRCSGHQTVEW